MTSHHPLSEPRTAADAPPAPAPVPTVLFTSRIADDPLWVVECDPLQLFGLFQNPVDWVRSLGRLPGWGFGTAVLTPDFVITVNETREPRLAEAVLVQGINNTNALTLSVSRDCAIAVVNELPAGPAPDEASTDPFGAFWTELADDDSTGAPEKRRDLDLYPVPKYGHWYGHYQIHDADDTEEEVARRTAKFMCASLYDPIGYALMLNGLTKRLSMQDGPEGDSGDEYRIVPPQEGQYRHFTVYANVERKNWPQHGRDDDPEPDPYVCTVVAGPATAGVDGGAPTGRDSQTELTNAYGVVKRYGSGKNPLVGEEAGFPASVAFPPEGDGLASTGFEESRVGGR